MRNHAAVRLTVLLALVGLLVGACSSAPSENVGSTVEGVASGDVYNFGAIAHPGSCMDAPGRRYGGRDADPGVELQRHRRAVVRAGE